MPRISMSGQEKSKYHDWKEIQALLYMSFFEENPKREKWIRNKIKKILEEEQKNDREDNKRNND